MSGPTPFGPAEAVHLLGRLQFGVRAEDVERAVKEGLDQTLDRLLSLQPETPVFEQAEASLRATAFATGNIDDLKSWWHYRMLHSANPLREKLALCWHNHFATSDAKVNSVPMMAAQNDLFRTHAGGSFREMLFAAARDPAMLVWLDGNANRKRHANENFAREVMELFTLGIGNYTEADIRNAARAFSGWHLRDKAFWFNASQHDEGEKTIFGKSGRYTGQEVLELCVDHPACPRFLAKKLLILVMTPVPTEEQITRVAQNYQKHDLQTGPVLRELCRSPEFFAPEHRRSIIKSPLDFVLGTLRALGDNIHWNVVRDYLTRLGQDVFLPPSVKGWDGGRQWIQSSSWIIRWNFVTELLYESKIAAVRDIPDVSRQDWELLLLGKPLEGGIAEQLDPRDPDQRREMLHVLLSLPEYQLM